MICYFDTSAFVPLLVPEPSSAACRRLWDDADDVITSQLLYVETAAALALGVRTKRLTREREAEALQVLDRFWSDFYVVEPDDRLVSRAAMLTSQQALRAYDAVHCATAEQVNDSDLIFASGDRQQLKAGEALGFCVADVNEVDFL
ncbi:type II toxin-antitoxin system VapC family toxin [Kribbella catacumbae]|uniref:type II toxin-antitoxin system VapC family toxin n=1 Tax=Kribbella catacumbae TaxID=460086 RepID=UPI00037903A5|nr:type II toxin-antitoxin system VapC family toxin [Kribbella catacumbae]